jgi:hypothetical protein
MVPTSTTKLTQITLPRTMIIESARVVGGGAALGIGAG